MLVKTESDGSYSSITIEDSGKHYTYELGIRNSEDGSCVVWYENADGEVYTLLDIKANGSIASDKPTLE